MKKLQFNLDKEWREKNVDFLWTVSTKGMEIEAKIDQLQQDLVACEVREALKEVLESGIFSVEEARRGQMAMRLAFTPPDWGDAAPRIMVPLSEVLEELLKALAETKKVIDSDYSAESDRQREYAEFRVDNGALADLLAEASHRLRGFGGSFTP